MFLLCGAARASRTRRRRSPAAPAGAGPLRPEGDDRCPRCPATPRRCHCARCRWRCPRRWPCRPRVQPSRRTCRRSTRSRSVATTRTRSAPPTPRAPGTITQQLIEDRPILRPGELLETVPGLIVTQHSGEGKANQFYLRGFNLDHGTDFRTTVDGMPVNQRTHAHGQGYTDLNFVIPELVSRLDYKKGPYYAEQGRLRVRRRGRASRTPTGSSGRSPPPSGSANTAIAALLLGDSADFGGGRPGRTRSSRCTTTDRG